jgi:hypothetical protein
MQVGKRIGWPVTCSFIVSSVFLRHHLMSSSGRQFCRQQSPPEWPHALRRGLSAKLLLDRGFESHWGHGYLYLTSVVYCQVGVSARSLIEGIPTECGVSECDLVTSKRSRPRSTLGCYTTGKEKYAPGDERLWLFWLTSRTTFIILIPTSIYS